MNEHTCINTVNPLQPQQPCQACIEHSTRKAQRRQSLVLEIRAAINRNSYEGYSNTPDYVLAELAVAALDAFELATIGRMGSKG